MLRSISVKNFVATCAGSQNANSVPTCWSFNPDAGLSGDLEEQHFHNGASKPHGRVLHRYRAFSEHAWWRIVICRTQRNLWAVATNLKPADKVFCKADLM